MPLLLRFFAPFLLASLLNSIYNTVDAVIIGQYAGSVGIVAVSLGGKMLNLFTQISLALAGGGQVLIAQLVGARQHGELNSAIGTLLSEMAVLSLLFAAVTLFLSRPILVWLNTPAASFEPALAYLRITCAGLPLIFGYNAVSSVLRGMGDSKSPLLFIAVAAAVNLVLDVVFIVYLGLGAAGTAYATVIGQGVSLVFSLIVLYRRRERFGFDFKWASFKVDWRKLGVMLRIGLPMALRSCCIHVTQLVIMGLVNLYGLTGAAAYAIGDKLVHLTNIFSMSTAQAAGAMIGQNIGAGRFDRVRGVVRSGLTVTLSAAVLLTALSLLFPKTIFGFFTAEPGVLALAQPFMRIACIIYFLGALMGAYDGVVTGTGNALLGFTGGFLDGVVFRFGFSLLFARALNMGVTGFFLGDALARLGPVLIGMVYYYSGAWKHRKKLVQDNT